MKQRPTGLSLSEAAGGFLRQRRIRPFKNIVGANSRNEDGLQVADMIDQAKPTQKAETRQDHLQNFDLNTKVIFENGDLHGLFCFFNSEE